MSELGFAPGRRRPAAVSTPNPPPSAGSMGGSACESRASVLSRHWRCRCYRTMAQRTQRVLGGKGQSVTRQSNRSRARLNARPVQRGHQRRVRAAKGNPRGGGSRVTGQRLRVSQLSVKRRARAHAVRAPTPQTGSSPEAVLFVSCLLPCVLWVWTKVEGSVSITAKSPGLPCSSLPPR